MNKKKILALLVSSAFLFAACGDDDSPSSPNKPEKEISSSSEEDDCDASDDECEEKSSSSKKGDSKSSSSKSNDKKSSDSKDAKSSSSAKDNNESLSSAAKDGKSSSSAAKDVSSSSVTEAESSSSVVVPSGARAATFDDLEKNMELELFGEKIYLSTGSKQGFFALRIPDTLWVATFIDFANGQVTFAKDNVGMEYVDAPNAKKIMDAINPKFSLNFIVDKDGVVKYAVNDSKEYKEAVKAQVAIPSGKVSKAEDVKDKVYSCTDGDTTRTFTFFDNSFIVENSAGNKVAYWMAGHYDIQRSTLLMRPAYYDKSIYPLYTYQVGSDNSISSTKSNAKSMSCNVDDKNVKYQKASDVVGEWQTLNDGIEWEFSLKNDGSYELVAFENNKNVEAKSGFWEIYGDQLMMRNKGCLHPQECSTAIHGAVEVKSDRLNFDHSDPDTPKIPKSFEAPQYE